MIQAINFITEQPRWDQKVVLVLMIHSGNLELALTCAGV